MRILVSGMNGTVAPVCARELKRLGHEVVAWDREKWAVDSRDEVRAAFAQVGPDAVFHIATGPLEWAAWIAQACAERLIPLLHTSSVSVFGAHQRGPLGPDSVPEPDDDYGRYKLQGERLIHDAYPEAASYRIGWQIGDAPGSNNMIDYFYNNRGENGVLKVSRTWIPASSRLNDTAECLCRHFIEGFQGIFHVDSNPGLSLFEIARLILPDWSIEPIEEPVRDNRMVDSRISIQSLQ